MGLPPRPLPDEVIETEILPRLPALSLLRFSSVCKLWKSIIFDPEFVKSHLSCTSQNRNDENLVMLKCSPLENAVDCDISIFSFFNSKETILSDLFRNPTRYNTSLIGSVNGLICLFFREVQKFAIWNPAIRQVKIIDSPTKGLMSFKFYGFGWDAVDNDYKVVMSFYKRRNYVYSCKSDGWILLTNLSVFPPDDHCYVPSLIVKGMPYWTGRDSKLGYVERTIYVPFKFEVGSNEFRRLPKFEYVKSRNDGFLLVDLKERISALVYETFSETCWVDLYGLDESCGVWSKMYNVGRIPCYLENNLCHYVTYGGQIVFNLEKEVVCDDPAINRTVINTISEVVWYDPKINKIEGLGNRKGELIKCYSYKASLVYLEGMKPLHEPAKSRKVTKRKREMAKSTDRPLHEPAKSRKVTKRKREMAKSTDRPLHEPAKSRKVTKRKREMAKSTDRPLHEPAKSRKVTKRKREMAKSTDRPLHEPAKSRKVTKRKREMAKSTDRPRRSGRTINKNPKYLD